MLMMIKRQERCQGSQESYAAHADHGSGGLDVLFDSGGTIGVSVDRATGWSEASGRVIGGMERYSTLNVPFSSILIRQSARRDLSLG